MASYGEPKHLDKINKLVTVYDVGSIELNLDYFSFMYDLNMMYPEDFVELFGPPGKTDNLISGYPNCEKVKNTLNLLKQKLSSRKRVNIEDNLLIDEPTFNEINSKI